MTNLQLLTLLPDGFRGGRQRVRWTKPRRSRGASLVGVVVVGDRESTIAPKGAYRDTNSGWGLSALVFCAVNERHNAVDEVWCEAKLGHFVRATILLDIGFQHSVEDIVGREAVAIELIFPKFGSRSLLNDPGRYDLVISIAPPG